MKKLSFDKKITKKNIKKPNVSGLHIDKISKKQKLLNLVENGGSEKISEWNFLYILVFFLILFSILFFSLAKLQIVDGSEMVARSQSNSIRRTSVTAYRGVIFDKNGNKLVENIPAINVYINVDVFLENGFEINEDKLKEVTGTLELVLGDKWKSGDEEDEYSSIYEKVISIYESDPYFSNILIAKDINNDMSIDIKAKGEELEGIELQDESKRSYIYPEQFAHILGYVGQASAEDIENYEYVSSNDTVGKIGIEKYYNEILAGTNGEEATEVNALGHSITGDSYTISSSVSGKSLYLTLDLDVQTKMYELMEDAVAENGATGAALIVEDVNNGEILSMVSYPGYDNNLFIGGISQDEYNKLLNDDSVPLLNRPIVAQVPPGSTFKTLVAAAALDAGVINKSTIYISKYGYTFTNGATFQEFQNHAYGPLNVVQAIARSSNIYFCETIRDWDIEALVPYLEAFGIGQYTGIDIPGEAAGRLPSPENKIYLAENGATWLDPIWYPEGDGCNSVIGQGITLVTPIQMVNWIAAIANGGTLYTPHLLQKTVDENGVEEDISYTPLNTDFISKDALDIVKEGMWSVVNSDIGSASILRNLGEEIALKTGTAEFGALNEDGEYEHTHAWIAGFYPYDDPKYSFVIFFEDGGLSFDSLKYSKNVLSWLIDSGYK
ncbi:MAG: penicillin-binding protein 2 [Candidatus Dojkabacteria bacterium]|nr:penicillin-binding protein 2 [Candidatus Dojkabacteria bacterium]